MGLQSSSSTDPGTRAGQPGSVTRLQLVERGIQRLEAAGRETPRRTAEWILADVLDCDRARIYARADAPVAPDDARQFNDLVERRAAGEPLQHVLGYASFRGLQIEVSPDVMVPRPETEQVVEVALHAVADVDAPRVLDVGTGSGCIALALKHERPDAAVHACDVSSNALRVARHNAERLGVDIALAESDLFNNAFFDQMPGGLDLLVSNPPYIPDAEADTLPPVVRTYDPDVALFSGDDPLRFYRALAEAAQALCTSGAAVVLEAHADHADAVAALLREAGLANVQVEPDLSGRPRIVRGRHETRASTTPHERDAQPRTP